MAGASSESITEIDWNLAVGGTGSGFETKHLNEKDLKAVDELSGAGKRRDERELTDLREKYPLDALTELFDFKKDITRQNLETRLAEAARYGRETWILMFDLDHFKEVNDAFGHPEGDKILIAFSKALKESCRESDLPMRYGGEEFTLALFNVEGRIPVEDVVERLTENFAKELAVLAGKSDDLGYKEMVKTLTFSGGASRVQFQEVKEISASELPRSIRKSEPVEGLVKRADDLLYKAKNSGRARVFIEGQDEPILLND